MSDDYISTELRGKVVTASEDLCEYCKSPRKFSPQPFVLEHIAPQASGGTSVFENLALACGGCNGHKYTKTEALDPITGQFEPLFHPREDVWKENFKWNPTYTKVIGISASGRATVQALKLNRPELVNLRGILLIAGVHPFGSEPE